MKPYIETRIGNKYEFSNLTRKQRILLQKELEKKENNQNLEFIEDLIYTLLSFNYNLTKEEYEDVLDYNVETYGFNETYEMLTFIIEDVFTQVGGDTQKKVNPYLQSKREEKAIEEVE